MKNFWGVILIPGYTVTKTNMNTQNDAIFERRYILKTVILGIYVRSGGAFLVITMCFYKRKEPL